MQAPADLQSIAWQSYLNEIRGRASWPDFAEQWAQFQSIFAGRRRELGPPPVWLPGREQRRTSNLARRMDELGFGSYEALHSWSTRERARFWEMALTTLGVVLDQPPSAILDLGRGPAHPEWLPGARLNIVNSCFNAPADAVAVISGAEGTADLRTTTYRELRVAVNRFANGLKGHGYGPGDGVALYMPMTLECVVAYLGTIAAGCHVVSVADSFPPPELARRIEIGGARLVVSVDAFVRGGKRIELLKQVVAADAAPAVVVALDPHAPPELRPDDCLWHDFLSSADSHTAVASSPRELINVLFSSGTTGTPKAIPWTHLTPIKCAMDGHFHHDIQPGDVVAWPTNIGWMMGPWLIFSSLVNRAAMALFEGNPGGAEFATFVQRARVSVLGVVPSLVRAWRSGGATDRADWSGVRILSSTGEPSNREDYLWLMSRTAYRAPVIEYCGGTEIGGGHLTGSVLQPASPATFSTSALGLEVVVLDEENHAVGEGESGELFLVPPSIGLSQELLNADHHRIYYQDCPSGPNGELLRRHGDRVERLGGGYLRAQGRADDTMNLGGIKVSSREIELVIEQHPAVYECAAVAVQKGGEGADHLVLFLVLESEVQSAPGIAELQPMLRQGLNPLFKISDVVTVEQLPRTPSNKLMRRRLRDRYPELRSD